MRGQRVLVSGMGGELGSLVASLLEAEPWVGSLLGIDDDPPRRRLRRSEFHLIEPSDRQRIVDVVTAFDPHVLVHLAVWEPDARAGTDLGQAAHLRGRHVDRCRPPPSARPCRRSSCAAASRSTAAVAAPSPGPTRMRPPRRPASTAGWLPRSKRRPHRVGATHRRRRQRPSAGAGARAHTCRALSAGCCANPSCRSACSPIRRSRSSSTPTRRGRSSQPPSSVRKVRSTSSRPVRSSTMQAIRRGRRLPLPLVGPEWRVVRQTQLPARRAVARARDGADPSRPARRRRPTDVDPRYRTARAPPRR